ncbi:hypothetical protein [Halobacterium bonnevillei]|uniref:Uncharacterized protein n=1 Tax=Halobacterium bonnevillei TaxID=2692200 RepID=A0A6B0SML0_9EURY|nr:hypothetical protein [Halobacterium bonnevillei]MXR22447.1 hypothetical protein [Halobacterium bonnevillei]
MPSATDASHDTTASSLFYDKLLDYLLVALLVVGWIGVTALTEIDRSFADEIARDVVTNSETPLGLSEQALAAGTPKLAVFVVFAVLVYVAVDVVFAALGGLLAGLLA